MPKRNHWLSVACMLMCAASCGCNGKLKAPSFGLGKDAADELVIPLHVKGTVAEFAALLGGGNIPVQAYGVVVGLGENGSSEVPAHLRSSLREYLSKQDMGSSRWGTESIPPSRILRDKDTAVVFVGGGIASGSPVGERFDIFVRVLPQTQTRSLSGGVLMPIDLSLAFAGVSQPGRKTKTWASAGGAVFVDPFTDPASPAQGASELEGRIIGGGKVIRNQPLRLQLRRPDYQMAQLIQQGVVSRFDSETGTLMSKVARGRSRSIVEIEIPDDYTDDYDHLLELVMHLPIRFGEGGWEAYARRIAARMAQPDAEHRELSLVLEAMGRQITMVLRGLYTSDVPAAAFYAAKAGLRLDDDLAVQVITRLAATSDSPLQIPAIEELGMHGHITTPATVLRRLIDDPNQAVRIAAYESLRKRGDTRVVTTTDIPEQFQFDVVASNSQPVVYATQSRQARIALLGGALPVKRPIFFEAADELVTISALEGDDKLTVFRRIPVGGRISDPIEVSATARDLILALGTLPEPDHEGKITGLGLTYGQLVGVLYRMCDRGDIPARFVLQQAPGMQRIYKGAATTGRPDMPDQ